MAAIALLSLLILAVLLVRHRSFRRRLARVAARLSAEPLTSLMGTDGAVPPPPGTEDEGRLRGILERLERVTEGATEAFVLSAEDAVRFRQTLDTMPEGVVVCGEDGRVRFRNAKAESLIGTRRADVLAAQAVDELVAVSLAGEAAERTVEHYGPPRQTIVVRTTPVDDGRRTLGVVAVLDDVTERRQLETVRRDFVANVSHELKTPVGALGLLAETLAGEEDPAIAGRLAARIQAESFRVSRIIEDLMDLSTIEGQESPEKEPTEVNLIMAEATERVRQTAECAAVTILEDEPESPLTVLGDRRQLVSALSNLLDNAVKYSDGGSEVVFTARVDGSFVDLVVKDEGVGIPARDLERIFERFYRVDQGRSRQTGGTGLGLSIVRHVAHNHGGQVKVESHEGEGSTFTFRLPLAGAPDGAGTPAVGQMAHATHHGR